MKNGPQTDHDYTIHALNIHGAFFERWCQHVIHQSDMWRLISTNYPVAYLKEGAARQVEESTLDIRARHGPQSAYMKSFESIDLLIECKKNNAEFIEWVSFPSTDTSTFFPCVEVTSAQTHISEPQIRAYPHPVTLNIPAADEARETRGDYREYIKRKGGGTGVTKTANIAVSDAARQVALAVRSVVAEESQPINCGRFNPTSETFRDKKFYLPVIVTSARLVKCEFNPADVGPDGEIEYDKVELAPMPYLIYKYALPYHLQSSFKFTVADTLLYGSPDPFMRLDVWVVNSGEFASFLGNLPTLVSDLFNHA